MKQIQIIIFLIIPINIIFAQTNNDIFQSLYRNNNFEGKITINQDSLISYLVKKHTEINKNIRGIQGKKIIIYMNSGLNSRNRAEAVRDSFRINNPNMPVELRYSSPFWQVYAGNFRTRTEALRAFQTIKKKYPKAFIVDALIDLKMLN